MINIIGELMIEYALTSKKSNNASPTIFVKSRKLRLGGPVVNIARNLRALGIEFAICAFSGEKDREFVNRSLEFNCSQNILIEHEGHTDCLYHIRDHDEDRFYYELGAIQFCHIENLRSSMQNFDYSLLSGSRHRILRNQFATWKNANPSPKIIWCPNYALYEYSKEEAGELLKISKIVAINNDEMNFLTKLLGMDELELTRHQDVFIVTHGDKGVTLYSHSKHSSHSTIASSSGVKGDYHGAGDLFISAFLSVYLKNSNIFEAASFASHLAGKFVGAKSSGEDWPQIEFL